MYIRSMIIKTVRMIKNKLLMVFVEHPLFSILAKVGTSVLMCVTTSIVMQYKHRHNTMDAFTVMALKFVCKFLISARSFFLRDILIVGF